MFIINLLNKVPVKVLIRSTNHAHIAFDFFKNSFKMDL